jgi:hypothetical protein
MAFSFPTTVPRDNGGRTTCPEATPSQPLMSDHPEFNPGVGVPTEALGRIVSGLVRPVPDDSRTACSWRLMSTAVPPILTIGDWSSLGLVHRVLTF